MLLLLLQANNVYPNQMWHFAASEPGLHWMHICPQKRYPAGIKLELEVRMKEKFYLILGRSFFHP